MSKARIIIKFKDPLYLQYQTYKANINNLKIGFNFFSLSNLDNLEFIYPLINTPGNIIESNLVFQRFLSNLFAIDPSLILDNLYSVIDSGLPVTLMKQALDESAYVGANLLNYYFVEVDEAVLNIRYNQLVALQKIPGSGIEIVHIRAKLADFETSISMLDASLTQATAKNIKNKTIFQENSLSQMDKKAILEDVDPISSQNKTGATVTNISIVNDFFDNCGIKYSSLTNGVKIVDIEQAWRPSSVTGLPIYGGGYNYHSSIAKAKHGTNTQNIVYKTPSSASYLSGLCRSAPRVVSSTWYSFTDERREAALIATTIGGGSITSKSDVFLLELQVSLAGAYFPVEIEDSMFQAIETAVNAKYIIIEAAGNGGVDLNTFNYSSLMSSNGIKNLSTENTGAIMVGALTNPIPTIHTCNNGNRVNYYCFANSVLTASGISYRSTSLASAIMAALVVHLQSKSKQLKLRTMKNLELKGLLNLLFPAKVPSTNYLRTVIDNYIAALI